MIVIGCTAEKLAGPNSVALLTDQILEHIIRQSVFTHALVLENFMKIYVLTFHYTKTNFYFIQKLDRRQGPVHSALLLNSHGEIYPDE